jgi:hypothetical protein
MELEAVATLALACLVMLKIVFFSVLDDVKFAILWLLVDVAGIILSVIVIVNTLPRLLH